MRLAPLPYSKLRRYSKAIGLRLVLAAAILFVLQDKLVLRPEAGGSEVALVSQAGWSSAWLHEGRFLGKVYTAQPSPRSTVIIYHGNAGSISDREPLAQTLTRMGFRVVLVEYPGFGEREGWATLTGALDASIEAFDVAKKTWTGPLFVLGESFGAGMAAEVVGRRKDAVAGAILFTPWDSLYNVVNGKFFQVPVGLLLKQRFDSIAALQRYHGKVQLVAAGKDTLIPVKHARALAKALPGALYRELPNAGHNTWPYELTTKDWNQLMSGIGAATNLDVHPTP